MTPFHKYFLKIVSQTHLHSGHLCNSTLEYLKKINLFLNIYFSLTYLIQHILKYSSRMNEQRNQNNNFCYVGKTAMLKNVLFLFKIFVFVPFTWAIFVILIKLIDGEVYASKLDSF